MKMTFLLVSLFLSLLLIRLEADPNSAAPSPSSSNPWQLLAHQGEDMAAAIKQQQTHPLHQLDEAVAREVGTLRSTGDALPADEQKIYMEGLAKLTELAHGIHVDAHHGAWEQAALKQAKFVDTLKKTEVLIRQKN